MTPRERQAPRAHCLNPDACAASRPTTHCRACANRALASSPEWRERQRAGARERMRDPDARERHIAVATENIRRAHEKLGAEWFREQGRKIHAISRQPEHMASFLATRAAAGRKRTETLIGHIPPEYRDQYRHLVRVKKLRREEATAAIMEMVARDRAQAERDAAARRAVEVEERRQRLMRGRRAA